MVLSTPKTQIPETKAQQPCILCGSHNTSLKWSNTRGYPVHECQDCSFLFIEQTSSKNELEEFYSQDYFMASFALQENDLVAAAATPKISTEAADIDRTIKKHKPDAKKVAEVGCSWGYLLWNLEKLGYKVKGYELSQATSEAGSRQLGIDITSGFFQAQPKRFDVVILRHVLEHVPDPKELLQLIAESLSDGGLLILEGPNLDSISSRLFGKNVSWVSPPDHVSFPTFKSLIFAGESLGLECVDKSTRRGRGISLFHQALLNTVALFYGGKDQAKKTLGGIHEKPGDRKLGTAKMLALKSVSLIDRLVSPINLLLERSLLEEEMRIVFRK